MAGVKKLTKPVTITTIVEETQHEALRYISYKEHKTMAEIIRAALEEYIDKKSQEYPIEVSLPSS